MRSRQKLARWIGLIYAAAVIAALLAAAVVGAEQLGTLGRSSPAALVGATVCWMLVPLVLFQPWRKFLASQLRGSHLLRIHLWSWLGRYLPGKIAMPAAKVALTRGAAGTPRAVWAVAMENASFLMAGAGAGAVLLVSTTAGHEKAETILSFSALLSLSCAWACCRLLPAIATRVALLRRWLPSGTGERGSASLIDCAAFTGAHALTALSLALIASSVSEHGIPLGYALAIASVANIAGIVAPFAPAGLGVREGILLALIAPHVGLEPAAAIVVAHRATSIVADVAILSLLPFFRLKPRTVPPVP